MDSSIPFDEQRTGSRNSSWNVANNASVPQHRDTIPCPTRQKNRQYLIVPDFRQNRQIFYTPIFLRLRYVGPTWFRRVNQPRANVLVITNLFPYCINEIKQPPCTTMHAYSHGTVRRNVYKSKQGNTTNLNVSFSVENGKRTAQVGFKPTTYCLRGRCSTN